MWPLRFWILALALPIFSGCAVPARGVYHTVQPGQTFFSIARAYGVNEQYLARLNGVSDPARIRSGQRLYVPGAGREIDIAARPAAKNPPPPPPRRDSPPQSATARPRPPNPPEKPKPSTDAPSPAEKGRFAWPLQGKILQNFGRNGNRNCNGVEIAAAEATPVRAAADGRVTYSGNGIRGYGNLIILKHADTFFTVYAFNRQNLVKPGALVKRGERIALSGSPPDGGSPRLHFEIRQGKAAVNPIFYLP